MNQSEIDKFISAFASLTPNQSAACGAVFGALIGDAMGAPLEFLGRLPTELEVEKAMQLTGGGVLGVAPGQITDDGEMTLALLHAIAKGNGRYNPDLAAEAYVDWAYSNPIDIGGATASALKTGGARDAKTVYRRAMDYNQESQANGALMRATPLALISTRHSVEETIEIAIQDTRLTHPNQICQECTVAYVLAIRHLILAPGDIDGAITSAENYLSLRQAEPYTWLKEAKDSASLTPASPKIGHVKIAFMHAFFHLKKESSYLSALKLTLSSGGDTDTNGCIVGGLIGANYDTSETKDRNDLLSMFLTKYVRINMSHRRSCRYSPTRFIDTLNICL